MSLSAALARYKRIAEFAASRVGDYTELCALELATYRNALVSMISAYVAMIFCAIFALGFFSLAVLVSFWDSDYRVIAAWSIFAAWLVLAVLAFVIARKSAPDAAPQSILSQQIKLDLDTIKGNYEYDDRIDSTR
ncbi:phage holin family protein [Pigmentiphaga aceris]|uniref:Phage holin family protein n=1 Tax=Pigmentiphaga aceris TaxID=1940612 RepID=A0A5C0AZ85_9BURK|nr:phage holin family protein [Pigmentiphaga aceris]QEI06996.1 phage holin family protein [Pigmentiphaga aceris]